MTPAVFGSSQSVLATRAEEQRFRIDKPNSQPRAALLIGIDAATRDLVADLAAARPEQRRVFELSPGPIDDASHVSSWLAALGEKTAALGEAVAAANIVVVIAAAGADAQAATVIGDVCRARGVRMTALVVHAHEHNEAEIATTLAHLRPLAAMVVVAGDDDYVADMLLALQA